MEKKYWVIVDPDTGIYANVKLTDEEVEMYRKEGWEVKIPTPFLSSANTDVRKKENRIIDMLEEK